MYREKNKAVLDQLDCDEYEFIPKVVAKSKFMDFYTLEADHNSLKIKKYDEIVVSICWSWNEPKMYFTSGLLTYRLIDTKEALIAAFFALDHANDEFNKKLAKYEL